MKMMIKLVIAGFILFSSNLSLAATPTTPLNPENVSPFYPEVTSKPPNIVNARYDTLPVCPTTPSNCPDINEKGGDPTTCPDYCTVTRSPESLPFASGTNQVTATNIINPVCPAAYVALTTFNMQNEATYKATPTAINPIAGMATYNSYKNAGYHCGIYGSQRVSNRYCNGAYHDGDIVDNINNAGGNVSWVQNSYKDGCYCATFGCSADCSCSTAGANPRWKYRYYYMQCTPPPGLYLTGSAAPASVVCGRAKTTWNTLNPDITQLSAPQ